jgi:hypothetical protein
MSEKPSRRDRTKPIELLGLSGVFALFVAVVVAISSRDLMLAVISLGAGFIASIVVLATLALTVDASPEERIDLDEQDRGQGH